MPVRSDTPRHVVAIGHSHLYAVEQAYRDLQASGALSHLRMDFVQLWDSRFAPPVTDGKLHPRASEILNACRYDAVVSFVAGNCYSYLCFVRPERLFDFVPPDRTYLPVDESAELVPYLAMRRRLVEISDANGFLAALPAIRAATSLPMLHVESPPPVGCEKHILAHPHALEEALRRWGPAPALLRYKLRELQSAYYRDVCRDLGICFVPAPREMQDDRGFLIEKAFANDSLHANSTYGKAVIGQLASLLSDPSQRSL